MPGSCENTPSDSCFSHLCLGCAHQHGTILGGREEAREGGLLLTSLSFCCPGMLFWPGMLSCCLLGVQVRRDQAVQLLPVPCLNQPLIEFVFYHSLQLLPLIPETDKAAGKYGKITFIHSIILLPHLHYPNKLPDVSGRARLGSWTLQRQPEKVFTEWMWCWWTPKAEPGTLGEVIHNSPSHHPNHPAPGLPPLSPRGTAEKLSKKGEN